MEYLERTHVLHFGLELNASHVARAVDSHIKYKH